ncbi:gluconolaconase [Actinorhabdospora filicis]|uniref:Gluconolaconase n=1 Tax=Actinorhabdospora filicis TaxID=1785913 RepID=A0A9W6W2Q4_9ACTN|nr:SMP-30/gluconolactonase/LRE family protein [Actinorhabdospora filicis]GLZ77272.1 gluconolaconase [Actinorhabdospora filicis]
MKRSLIALAVGAALVFGVAAPAVAHPAVITGHAASLHPEGVAYDPSRDGFLVTSITHGTVSTVRKDGRTRTLVDDPALISTIGVHVDASRDRVLVASGDLGLADRSTPATTGKTAGLGIYSLRTGARLAFVDLAAVAGDGGDHLANDIAVDRDGTAYVTDSRAGIVYRVEPSGRAGVLARDARLTSPDGNGANGIVWREGVLIVGNYSAGTLWRVPVARPGDVRQVRVESMPGVDGLTLAPNGSIIAVTNTLGVAGTAKVRELRPSRDWASASVRESRAWPDAAPTTATVRRGTVYVLDGEMDALLSGALTDVFTLRRF